MPEKHQAITLIHYISCFIGNQIYNVENPVELKTGDIKRGS